MVVRNGGLVVCDALGARNSGVGADNVMMGGGACRIFVYRELPLNVEDQSRASSTRQNAL